MKAIRIPCLHLTMEMSSFPSATSLNPPNPSLHASNHSSTTTMHQLGIISLLLLCAIQSASLVLPNKPRSNSIDQGTTQIIQPINLIQPQNHAVPPPWGTDHEIRSNLTIHITLGDTAPVQTVYELLLKAKEQVHDRASQFGPMQPVPRPKLFPEMTQTIHKGLIYNLEPTRAFVRKRSPLEWGEFEAATSWLYENSKGLLGHRQLSFVLFRKIGVTTGNEVNLGVGKIAWLNSTMMAADATSRGFSR